MRRILCPVDFSETSAHALEQAEALSRWSNARLTVLYVYEPLFMPVPALPAPNDRVSEAELARARDETARFVAALAPRAAPDVIVDVDRPVSAILRHAATLRADLIVMGTHGAGGFERLMLGSVAEKVVRKATCPVLTVPPRAHATSRPPLSHLLCGVDFSEPSLAAVELAASLAAQSGAALDLVHVIEWPWHEPPAPHFAEIPAAQRDALLEFRRYVVAAAQGRLELVARDIVRDRAAATLRVCHGTPYVEILRLAADRGVDLIVLGVHGRAAIDQALFGSTTNHVVRTAACPVLTVRR